MRISYLFKYLKVTNKLLTNNMIMTRRGLTPIRRSIKMTIRADHGVFCYDTANIIDADGIIIFELII